MVCEPAQRRRVASGLTALIAIGMVARGLGWASLVAVTIPASDAAIVLGNQGSPAVAIGVHGAADAAVMVNAWLLLTEDEREI